jgi:hypothetical protein
MPYTPDDAASSYRRCAAACPTGAGALANSTGRGASATPTGGPTAAVTVSGRIGGVAVDCGSQSLAGATIDGRRPRYHRARGEHPMIRWMAAAWLVVASGAACSACAMNQPAPRPMAGDGAASPAAVLDVFFGLDDALPMTANFLCLGGGGMDGMPVTLSRRIGVDSPAASAFRVTTRSGRSLTPRCATLRPALGASKRHTVLLIGEFGDDPGDPPVRLEVIGSVPLLNGGDAMGLSSASVTPLPQGPSLRIGYRYAPASLPSSSCPTPTTRQIVQLTWAGGVTAPTGGDLGEAARGRMRVTLESGAVVTPVALADLGDNDNYTQLCLDAESPAVSVTAEAGVAVDPRGDLNPETTIRVTTDPEVIR